MRNVSYHRVPASRAPRIVPALSALAIALATGAYLLPRGGAPDVAEAAPHAAHAGGSLLADIGPHAPAAFAPRGARMKPHDVFSGQVIPQAAATATHVALAEAGSALPPMPPLRPSDLPRAEKAEPVAETIHVAADVPLPPRRPGDISVALKPDAPREQRPETVAAAPVPPEPLPAATAPAPRQIARLERQERAERTTAVPAAPADGRGFFERLFGGAPQAAAPQATNRREMMAYATQSDSGGLFGGLRSAVAPANPSSRYDRFTAIYDISARTVYLPNGQRLEAHSGLREHLDDPRYVHLRMRGATPPHLYELTPREALFHGVQALRLNPVGGAGAIHGRAGLLAHTYMLGPNGDSNGCVSFRDYNAFLRAYKNGEIRRLAVVAHM